MHLKLSRGVKKIRQSLLETQVIAAALINKEEWCYKHDIIIYRR